MIAVYRSTYMVPNRAITDVTQQDVSMLGAQHKLCQVNYLLVSFALLTLSCSALTLRCPSLP